MSPSAGEAVTINSPKNTFASSVCLERQIQTQQSVHHTYSLSKGLKTKMK